MSFLIFRGPGKSNNQNWRRIDQESAIETYPKWTEKSLHQRVSHLKEIDMISLKLEKICGKSKNFVLSSFEKQWKAIAIMSNL